MTPRLSALRDKFYREAFDKHDHTPSDPVSSAYAAGMADGTRDGFDQASAAWAAETEKLVSALERVNKFAKELCEDVNVSFHQPSIENADAVLERFKSWKAGE